ncbi:macrolide family glycosyltransferase [Amycolatopsis granulosa]|uniref:macrolide family glycosyltransferase n=1 Tax=Amycolatopsis granulosa TaxID=185684 RepID=UPI0014232E19|nr:MGT family glycosyltransferase [Amycolatopsis granulosa]
MKHALFVNVADHGHVNPTLAVVAQLVARGWRVTYAVGAEFVPQVRVVGAEPVVLPGVRDGGPPPEDLMAGVEVYHREAQAALPVLEAAIAGDLPDVIVYDFVAFAGKVLALKLGVPMVQLSPTHALFPGWEQVAFGVPSLSELPVYQRFQRFLDTHGLGCSVEQFQATADPKVVFVPRAFQMSPELLGPEHTFTGPALGDRSFQGRWRAPGGKPVLLVSLGSCFTDQPGFFRTCLDMAAGLGWHTVMAIGRHVDPATLGPVPDDVEIAAMVPQLDVLAMASAFVTHAGMGSVLEALYHGVPMVAVPQMAEQRLNAARLTELGLGVTLDRADVTVQALHNAVLRVSSDAGIAENVRGMREIVRTCGGAAEAADVVARTGDRSAGSGTQFQQAVGQLG